MSHFYYICHAFILLFQQQNDCKSCTIIRILIKYGHFNYKWVSWEKQRKIICSPGNLSFYLKRLLCQWNEASQQIGVSCWQGKKKKKKQRMKPLKIGHSWGENKWGSIFPKRTTSRMLRDSLPGLQYTTSIAFKITNCLSCL